VAESSPAREAAAAAAAELVEPGMTIGLGSGRAVWALTERLPARTPAVVASERTRELALRVGIDVLELDGSFELDLALDGADEVDGWLGLIKGGGGALLREKIVAMASERMIVIADASKRKATLGAYPLPVEVVRFGLVATRNMVAAYAAEAGCEGEIKLRLGKDGAPVLTDSGNLLLDCAFGRIDKPEMLDDALKRVPGVVEHGLFLGIADVAIVAGADGVVVLERDDARKDR
jgi:ribose 5-phosphate isomerase A